MVRALSWDRDSGGGSIIMNRRTVTESRLPGLILPCPTCGGRLVIRTLEPTFYSDDIKDVTHGCDQCGAELTRMIRMLDS
jgi:hypothetical protein